MYLRAFIAIFCLSLTACVSGYESGGDPALQLRGTTLAIIGDSTTQSVSFPSVDFGQSFSANFTVTNVGTGTLEIGQITIDNENFSVEQQGRQVAEGETASFTVTFAPQTFGDQVATLAFFTNDADNPIIKIQLSGRSNPAPTISDQNITLTFPEGINSRSFGDNGDSATIFFQEFDYDDPSNALTNDVELVIIGRYSGGQNEIIRKGTGGTEEERITLQNGKLSYYLTIFFGISTFIDFEIYFSFPDGRRSESTSYRLVRPEGAN